MSNLVQVARELVVPEEVELPENSFIVTIRRSRATAFPAACDREEYAYSPAQLRIHQYFGLIFCTFLL